MTAEMMKAAADPARAWTAWMRADRARGARALARAAEDRERAKDKRRR